MYPFSSPPHLWYIERTFDKLAQVGWSDRPPTWAETEPGAQQPAAPRWHEPPGRQRDSPPGHVSAGYSPPEGSRPIPRFGAYAELHAHSTFRHRRRCQHRRGGSRGGRPAGSAGHRAHRPRRALRRGALRRGRPNSTGKTVFAELAVRHRPHRCARSARSAPAGAGPRSGGLSAAVRRLAPPTSAAVRRAGCLYATPTLTDAAGGIARS